jgi:hypothetical protein
MCTIDWNLIWVFVTALATVLLAVVGWIQLSALAQTGKDTFLHDLKKDFFSPEERNLMFLMENKFIFFKKEPFGDKFPEIALFKVEMPNEIAKVTPVIKEYYTTQEVDDFILQHFEDLGLLFEKKRLNLYQIDQSFGYYVTTVYENPEIVKYIEWARKDDNDIYSKFEMLYNELKAA